MLAVAPLTIAGATSIAATAAARRSTTGAGVAVSVGVEAAATAASTPVVTLRGRGSTRRREVARSVPSARTSGLGGSTCVEAGITAERLAFVPWLVDELSDVHTQPKRCC